MQTFRSIVFPPFKPKGILDKVMINHYLLERSQFEQAVQQIENKLQWGLIDEAEADKRLIELVYDYDLDLSAENWEDVDWEEDEEGLPHKDSWTEDVEWDAESNYQSAEALKFLLSLSRGGGSTELESTFLLPPVFFTTIVGSCI